MQLEKRKDSAIQNRMFPSPYGEEVSATQNSMFPELSVYLFPSPYGEEVSATWTLGGDWIVNNESFRPLTGKR